jgi:RimJ/RimL family protein N-acetyltransferase
MADPIHTERLLLRPLRADDAEPIFALIGNWQVMRRLSSPPWPYKLEDAHDFIWPRLNRALTETSFAIILGDALIGVIDVRMNASAQLQRGPGPILGYWLGQPYWGRSYMTEAARGFVAHVFAAGVGNTIYSGAFADNAASLRVQEKLGFVRAGETTLYAKTRGGDFPHINTVLTRATFERSA